MGKIHEDKTYALKIRESANDGSDFTTPDADYRMLFLGEDGNIYLKDSSGTVTAVTGDVATHLADSADAHDASAISIADSGGDFTATDVEGALAELQTADEALAVAAITFTFDGGGSAVATGPGATQTVPFAGTITAVRVISDVSATAVVDIWKHTTLPTDANTITASAVPSLTADTDNTDSTLTGWTTSIAAGDVLRPNVDSNDNATFLEVTLTVVKT